VGSDIPVHATVIGSVPFHLAGNRRVTAPEPSTNLTIAQLAKFQVVDDITLMFGKMGIGHRGFPAWLDLLA
jgi:hypothetical protein